MNPDTCHCCEPPAGGTPLAVYNRPGLSAVVYRVGTFANFRQAMFQAISRAPELRGLSTRQSDDYAITIFELWAAVADILTFYQERIANETFLRTARLRASVLHLARMIGYELGPGSAATAYVSFTAEKGMQVRVPVGLRVQSVPEQDEKPQKYETLEAVTVRDWLNGAPLFPAPAGANPLGKGSTSAYLAAGDDGLLAAAALPAGTRLLVFDPVAKPPVEELTVQGVEIAHEHLRLRWSEPVRGAGWGLTSRVYPLARSYRLFGYNAPGSYPVAEIDPTTQRVTTWKMQAIGTGAPGTDNFAVAGGNYLYLDGRYDDLKAGTPLLLADGAAQQKLLVVTAVDQEEDKLGPLADTVTRLRVAPSFGTIQDRRQVVLHELKDPAVAFWGYDYPDHISATTLFIPGRRIDATTIEVDRPVEKNAYQAGYTVSLPEIEAGRRAILRNERQEPLVVAIGRAGIVSAEVVVEAVSQDPETASRLALDGKSAQSLSGLCSAALSSSISLSRSAAALKVTIGTVGPRRISTTVIGSFSPGQAAAGLQSLLRAADPDPRFARAVVLALDQRLIVFPGVANEAVRFEKTDDDGTTVVELGLDASRARSLTALASGELDPVPSYTKNPPRVAVRIGPVGPREIDLNPAAATLAAIAADLESKLNAADPAPGFQYARTAAVEKRLLIVPGPVGATQRDFLRVDLQVDGTLEMDRRSAVLLGNVALASHGETVAGEVLGDADPTLPFQSFQLQKSPVTYVPSGTEAGARSTLQVLVNGVLWGEVGSLYGQDPTAAVYTTRIDDQAVMTVRFGDGVTGARPPKGRANVTASYRKGLGLAGRVKANALRTLLDRPKGLRAASNPRDADGGADPETLEGARRNAPATVRTFGRAVSLLDFEYLALSRSEIAKAGVTWVWSGASRAAHLTVAGQQGATFSPEALARIYAGLSAQRDPNRRLLLANYAAVPILVTAVLQVSPTYVASRVAESARAALAAALSFEALEFGQSVHLSDVYAVLQGVPGVVSVDIDRLLFKQPAAVSNADFEAFLDERGVLRLADGSPAPVQSHLRIFPARPNGATGDPPVLPGELARVESPTQDLTLKTTGGLAG